MSGAYAPLAAVEAGDPVTGRAPVLFVGHGAPTMALDPGPAGAALARFGDTHPRPHAVLAVSAHWQAGRELGVTSALVNHAMHDFGGFDDALYELRWPAPGAPDLAARAAAALEGAGFRTRLEPARGLDHGVWIPLRIMYPAADVPVVQVALPMLPPAELSRFGAALASLREEGVLVLCSGGLVHNLSQIRLGASGAEVEEWAASFSEWVAGRLADSDAKGLLRWREEAPGAALAVPTTEHLDPLFVALGARAPDDRLEWVHRGIELGSLDLGSFAWMPG
jgi:4,5-DOPA dioxygenase extradiol